MLTTHGSSPRPHSVGMPALLYLETFGRTVREAFGITPLLVGSSIIDKRVIPRDIDVRLVLPETQYTEMIGPLSEYGQPFTRWAAFCMAFSALGKTMTGLPIDFQIQSEGQAYRFTTEACIEIGGKAHICVGKDAG